MDTDDTIAELGASRGATLEIANEPGWTLVLLEDIPARRRGEKIDGGPLGAKVRIVAAPVDCSDLIGKEGRAFDILQRSILKRPGYAEPKPKKWLFNKNRLRVTGRVEA